MIDLRLSEEQQLLRDTARDFARREIAPLVRRLEALPEHTIEPWPLCRDMYRKGVELGFTRLLLPESYGGLGRPMIDAVIAFEELGAADVSIAADYFSLNATVPLILAVAGDEQQKREWLGAEICTGEPLVLAGALSEPNVAGSELFTQNPDPRLGIRTSARGEGDRYVLHGQKSAFVTNCGIADRYFVLARTSFERPLWESISIFYVDAATPGLTAGKRTSMIGWKSSRHAELVLDNVHIDSSRRIGAEGQGGAVMASLPHMGVGLAACFVGLARTAYEYALEYSKKRMSGGVPIAQHQAVALKLADMYVDLQTARMLVWDAALACDQQPMAAATLKGPAAKTHAVDVAIRNAQRAVEILGGYGITSEYPAGRLLQDAWVGYACDFTRDVLRLAMAPFLPESG